MTSHANIDSDCLTEGMVGLCVLQAYEEHHWVQSPRDLDNIPNTSVRVYTPCPCSTDGGAGRGWAEMYWASGVALRTQESGRRPCLFDHFSQRKPGPGGGSQELHGVRNTWVPRVPKVLSRTQRKESASHHLSPKPQSSSMPCFTPLRVPVLWHFTQGTWPDDREPSLAQILCTGDRVLRPDAGVNCACANSKSTAFHEARGQSPQGQPLDLGPQSDFCQGPGFNNPNGLLHSTF